MFLFLVTLNSSVQASLLMYTSMMLVVNNLFQRYNFFRNNEAHQHDVIATEFESKQLPNNII